MPTSLRRARSAVICSSTLDLEEEITAQPKHAVIGKAYRSTDFPAPAMVNQSLVENARHGSLTLAKTP